MHLSPWELTACLVIVAVGAFVQGSVGFGINLIISPVIALVDPAAVPGAIVLLSLPLTATMAAREHDHVDRSGVAWIMVGRVPGTVLGVAVLAVVATDTVAAVVGAAILIAVALNVVRPNVTVTRGSAVAAGFGAGTLGTAAAIDGPPLALLYQHHRGEAIRATLAACFVIGTLMSAAALAVTGELHRDQLALTAALLPALLLGLLASAWGTRLLHGRSLRPAVLTFAGVAGGAALVRGLF